MNRPDDRRGYIGQPRHRERFDHGDRYRSSREVRDRERDEKRRSIRHNDYSEAEDMQISDGGSDHGDDTSMRLVSPIGHRERSRDELRRKNSFRDEEGLLSDSGIALLRAPNDDRIRDGVVFQFENYLGFLRKWIEYSNIEMEKTRVPGASQKKINEHITNATFAEKLRIILPPEVSSRDSLVHCDMVITGLPPSVFFGSGFGHKTWLAKAAAAKDLIDKCHRIGLISSRLHAAIGDHPVLEKNRRLPDFFKAVDALILLERKMSREQWPWDVLFARELESITLDKLKMVFTSVMQSIYFTAESEKRLGSSLDRVQMPVTMIDDADRIGQFCRECNMHGHSLKDCSVYYERRTRDDDRNSRRIRLPSRPRSRGSTRSDRKELIRNNTRDESQREKQKVLNSQTEIEMKIAQQREELLRRERVREMIEPLEGSWNAPTPSIQPYFPSILPYGNTNVLGSMGVGVPPLGLPGPVPPIMDSVLLEQQLRAAQEEEIRKKKDEDDKRLKEKEEELKKKMEIELEEKRRQMEEEIRKQVQQEERARLQIELSKQQSYVNFSSGFIGAPSTSNVGLSNGAFSGSSGLSGYSTGYGICATVDYEMEEIKRLVKETEEKLLVLQRNAQESTLSAIFQSRAFQTVAALGENANMLDQRQKQELLRELKALLSEAVPENSCRHRKAIRERQRDSIGRNLDRSHESDRSRDRIKRRSRSRSRDRHRSNDRKEKGNDYKEIRVQIGGITLRNLTPMEQRRLVSGDVVVAQDMKTGKWTTARITKVSGDRALLTIGGNTTWKKNLNDLYKEVPKGTM